MVVGGGGGGGGCVCVCVVIYYPKVDVLFKTYFMNIS